ncbi:PRC-barrel domain-containing protein [Streptomyces albulus]|nr:PRC-barrel domain-containing protein [Streptomyces noursei]
MNAPLGGTPQSLTGLHVVDVEGAKVGLVQQVYRDDATNEPEWITVRTGLFGMKETFVPLAGARRSGDELHVPHTKSTIKQAPRIDAEGHLDPSEEERLYRHYGLIRPGATEPTGPTSTPSVGAGGPAGPTGAAGTRGRWGGGGAAGPGARGAHRAAPHPGRWRAQQTHRRPDLGRRPPDGGLPRRRGSPRHRAVRGAVGIRRRGRRGRRTAPTEGATDDERPWRGRTSAADRGRTGRAEPDRARSPETRTRTGTGAGAGADPGRCPGPAVHFPGRVSSSSVLWSAAVPSLASGVA